MEIFKKSKELRRSLMAALLIAVALMIGAVNAQSREIKSEALFFPVVDGLVLDAIGGALKNAVTTKSMNGMTAWVDDQYQHLAEQSSEAFFTKFGPDITTFFRMTGTDWGLYSVFKSLGTIIAVLITIFMFWMIALGTIRVAEVKDTPLQLVGGLLVSIAIIFFSQQFAEFFFDITQMLWDKMNAPETLGGLEAWKVLAFMIYPVTFTTRMFGGTIEDVRSSESIKEAVMNIMEMAAAEAFKPIIIIVNIVLGIIFVKEVLNFMVEIVERYIVSCLLAVFMPVAAGTIPSKTTRGIFGKYLQMFVSQLFLLLMNAVFMMGILKMMTDGGLLVDASLTGWIFMFAYMRAAQRLDRYMFTMGLSVAVTGGNVFDQVGRSLHQLGGIVRGGQNGLDAAGGALVKAGVNGLNPGMAQVGRRLKDISHPLKTMASGETVKGGMAGFVNEAKRIGSAQDTISKLTPDMMDASMAKMAFMGGADARALSAMPSSTKQALLETMYGTHVPRLKNISFNQDGTQSGLLVDKKGNSAAVTIGGNKGGNVVGSLTASTPELKGETFDIHSSGIEKAGEHISIKGNGLNDASILSGVNLNEIEDPRIMDNLDHIVMNSDGSASLMAAVDDLDENGNLILDENNNPMQHEELLARSYDEGLVYDNGNAFSNLNGEMEADPVFSDLQDIRLNIEQGKASNMSDSIVHAFGVDEDGDYHERTMYNMAYFGEDYRPLNGKYVGTYGNYNDSTTGYYKVYDVTPDKCTSRDIGTGVEATMSEAEKENKLWNERNESKINRYNNLIKNHTLHSSKKLDTQRSTQRYQRPKKGK